MRDPKPPLLASRAAICREHILIWMHSFDRSCWGLLVYYNGRSSLIPPPCHTRYSLVIRREGADSTATKVVRISDQRMIGRIGNDGLKGPACQRKVSILIIHGTERLGNAEIMWGIIDHHSSPES